MDLSSNQRTWIVFLGAAAITAAVAGLYFTAAGIDAESLRVALRSSAHASFIVLLVVFSQCSIAIGQSGVRFSDVQPLLRQYCFDCHGDGADEGNLTLDQFASAGEAAKDKHLWWRGEEANKKPRRSVFLLAHSLIVFAGEDSARMTILLHA